MLEINKKIYKSVRRKLLSTVLALIIIFSGFYFYRVDGIEIKDGYYKIPVSLLKKYENQLSMGNNALYPQGILEVKNGKMRLKLRFNSLKFMNFTGYLSDLKVKDRKVEVLSKYDKYDVYNDPENGTDPNYKGKKYPEDMIFNISEKEDEIPVKVYVPVMQELGSGEQDARLKIDWSKGPVKIQDNKFESMGKGENENREYSETVRKIEEKQTGDRVSNLPKLEKGEALKLENGIYSVNVEIYNEREDKPSMGNQSMSHRAEVLADKGKYRMLIGSDKMTVQNITASLVSLQIMDDNDNYYFAQPHAFDLEIEGDPDKRPKVFDFNILRKDPFIYVKVDPKVKPMGEVPIGARLKIDWNSLNKINESEAVLLNEMKTGTKRPKFNPDSEIRKTIDGITFIAPPNTFRENIRFKYEIVFGGPEYIDTMNRLGRGTEFKIYSFKAENDYGVPQKNEKKIKVIIPKADLFEGNMSIRYIDNMKEIPINYRGSSVEFQLEKLGKIAIISDKKNTMRSGTSAKAIKKSTRNNSPLLTQKGTSASRKSSKSGKKQTDSKSGGAVPKKSETEKTDEKKPAPAVLKNDDENFNEKLEGEQFSGNRKSAEKETAEPKESAKIIFFSIVFLTAVAGLSIYVYMNIGKKLLYELKLNEALKKELEKCGGKR